jgi:hypothetical protein
VLLHSVGSFVDAMTMPRDSELWEEFIRNDLCMLCGQKGFIRTDQRSPAGVYCGGIGFCICPNGRAWKNSGIPITELIDLMEKASAKTTESSPK